MNGAYIHGYDERETVRLRDQAATLVDLLHADTAFAPGTSVLEVGCGVGAQTITLARHSPGAAIIALDISEASLAQARRAARAEEVRGVAFCRADIFDLPFAPATFDHVLVCFVLEHLARPVAVLEALNAVLKPEGTITVIEGDHGSTYFHPDSEPARLAVRALVELQKRRGGNALIGRELYPALREAGFADVRVSPRMVYVDASRPDLVENFTKKTFTAMVEGVRTAAVSARLIDDATFARGVEDLHRTTGADGVFCYTFFKAVGRRPR
jgi:ubiquinone/menaquinone biosynthesis C-methylase UbiE